MAQTENHKLRPASHIRPSLGFVNKVLLAHAHTHAHTHSLPGHLWRLFCSDSRAMFATETCRVCPAESKIFTLWHFPENACCFLVQTVLPRVWEGNVAHAFADERPGGAPGWWEGQQGGTGEAGAQAGKRPPCMEGTEP